MLPPSREWQCSRKRCAWLAFSAQQSIRFMQGRIFIDRSGTLFDEVLSLLRDGPEWRPPEDRCVVWFAAGSTRGKGEGRRGQPCIQDMCCCVLTGLAVMGNTLTHKYAAAAAAVLPLIPQPHLPAPGTRAALLQPECPPAG